MYDTSVPIFIHFLNSLSAILKKAEAHCAARKIDPGEKFDWAWLAAHGIGHWVPPVAVTSTDPGPDPGTASDAVRRAQQRLAYYGYGIDATGVLDDTTMTVVRAFQRHFRPARVDGRLDASTAQTLARLVASLNNSSDLV